MLDVFYRDKNNNALEDKEANFDEEYISNMNPICLTSNQQELISIEFLVYENIGMMILYDEQRGNLTILHVITKVRRSCVG
jgi:hypothetical protein